MSGTITNGLSALIAAQRALQTTSNNIANANTAGYVRQRIDFVEQPGTPLGRITIGAGVAVADVSRVYDQFLTDNLRTSTSLEQRYAAFGDFATRLDTILGNPDTGVSASASSTRWKRSVATPRPLPSASSCCWKATAWPRA
jgi:flagellar hook-associated protein 1 FlgK